MNKLRKLEDRYASDDDEHDAEETDFERIYKSRKFESDPVSQSVTELKDKDELIANLQLQLYLREHGARPPKFPHFVKGQQTTEVNYYTDADRWIIEDALKRDWGDHVCL